MYASFAQNVAKNRDKNIPKQIIEKVIEDNAKKANISLTDDQVLVAKDVINYVYSNKNLSPEQIFQTKLYECLDKEGIIKPNKNA